MDRHSAGIINKGADWTLTQDTTQQGNEERYGHILLLIGNGDILTYYRAMRRMQEKGLDSAMVSWGPLTKRWNFQEFNNNEKYYPEFERTYPHSLDLSF